MLKAEPTDIDRGTTVADATHALAGLQHIGRNNTNRHIFIFTNLYFTLLRTRLFWCRILQRNNAPAHCLRPTRSYRRSTRTPASVEFASSMSIGIAGHGFICQRPLVYRIYNFTRVERKKPHSASLHVVLAPLLGVGGDSFAHGGVVPDPIPLPAVFNYKFANAASLLLQNRFRGRRVCQRRTLFRRQHRYCLVPQKRQRFSFGVYTFHSDKHMCGDQEGRDERYHGCVPSHPFVFFFVAFVGRVIYGAAGGGHAGYRAKPVPYPS